MDERRERDTDTGEISYGGGFSDVYTQSYADSVGQDKFFYPDTNHGNAEPRSDEGEYNVGFADQKNKTDGAENINISIPLNLYSYFAAFKNNL